MFGLGFTDFPRPFNTQYRAYSVSMLPGQERSDVEKGGKIIMPPSALDQLTRLNIVYPMLFKLTNPKTRQVTHCGVLEFVADEGKIYLPYWMMQNLLLGEGDFINIESASLNVATFSKFQPFSEDFLDISNPKAVLENALRNFACLTTGDVIAITYNDRIYELKVLETKPGQAVSIIECDMNVEFAPPLGYTEPQQIEGLSSEDESSLEEVADTTTPYGFVAFSGEGVRLDGKQRKDDNIKVASVPPLLERGIPDFNFQMGTLKFFRPPKKKLPSEVEKEATEIFKAFSGSGRSLRQTK